MRKGYYRKGYLGWAVLAAFLLCCLVFTGCEGDVTKMSSLAELSRPYVGEYQCEQLTLAGKDMLSDFEWVRLTLGYDGNAVISWKKTDENKGEYSMRYEADPDGETITFFPEKRGIAARTFPMKNGTVRIGMSLLGRYLEAVFRQ